MWVGIPGSTSSSSFILDRSLQHNSNSYIYISVICYCSFFSVWRQRSLLDNGYLPYIWMNLGLWVYGTAQTMLSDFFLLSFLYTLLFIKQTLRAWIPWITIRAAVVYWDEFYDWWFIHNITGVCCLWSYTMWEWG